MKILLAGSSGTIGTRLFEQLLKSHEVVGVDIKQNKWNRQLDALTISADLREIKELPCLPSDVDLVIHLAANARVYELVKKPELALDNILITFNVLEFMRENGIGKIIFASSRETYGNIMEERAVSEEAVRIEHCESPYAASKITGEALLHAYNKAYGIDFVIIRFSNVYGMYDDSDRVIPLWIRQSSKNEAIIVYGEDKVLDFTYIDDAVDGLMKAIDRFDQARGNTFNIAYGKGIRLLTVAQGMRRLLDANSEILTKENRTGEVWKFEADISKAKRLLGYQPKIGIEEGLEKTIQWYKRFG